MTQAPVSIFSHASDAAARVSALAWFMIGVSAVIFVGVMIAMVAAVMRNRRQDALGVDLRDRGLGWIVWGGTVMPALVLIAVFVVSLGAMSKFSPADPTALTIHVTGHQWWWQVDYAPTHGEPAFRTANEIHIPVGQPVRVILTTADVIHSFWVPQLQGKLDLIPGDTNVLRLQATRVGVFGGECAEYCGKQHAHMMLNVVSESDEQFAAWAANQARDAQTSTDSTISAGHALFTTTACVQCHTVRGTPAHGELGPDLTHVASRRTIAAGIAPTTLATIAGWIGNPQALKPGANMPTLRSYTGPQLRALAAYVESLK
jgi:cytochrome c oxidase subunit 2